MENPKLDNAIENKWVGIQGTILSKLTKEDYSEEVIFEQRAEWMSNMVKWRKNVPGRRTYKYKCTKVEDS